ARSSSRPPMVDAPPAPVGTADPGRDRSASRHGLVLAIGVVLVLVGAFASLMVGVINVSPMSFFERDTDAYEALVISRIPRTLALILSGGSLAVAGMIMQQVTHNRFVSPSTVGTTECAVLGIVIATMLFP